MPGGGWADPWSLLLTHTLRFHMKHAALLKQEAIHARGFLAYGLIDGFHLKHPPINQLGAQVNGCETLKFIMTKRVWEVHLKCPIRNFVSLILSLCVYLSALPKITCPRIFHRFFCGLFILFWISWSILFCTFLAFAISFLNIFHSFEMSRPLLPYSFFANWKSQWWNLTLKSGDGVGFFSWYVWGILISTRSPHLVEIGRGSAPQSHKRYKN